MTFGSLFSGIGGMDLGLERAGMECRWQCEIEPFPRQVLAARWPWIPCFEDVRKLTGDELEPVDLICGGYPCQPFSQAGKRGGAEDPRHLWPEFARIIRILRPRYVLLENVPGHLSLGFGDVLGDLAGLGFDAEWTCIRAADFGASHLRKRVFVVAYSSRDARNGSHGQDRTRRGVCEAGDDLADPADAIGRRGVGRAKTGIGADAIGRRGSASRIGDLADASDGQFPEPRRKQEARDGAGPTGPFAPGPNDARWPAILAKRPDLAPALESPVRGMADGAADWLDRALSNRTKRLKALGNGVVPQVAEWIGRRIMEAAHAAE